VDVLSMVDVALDRKESLGWGHGQDDLRRVREGLEYAIVAALDDAIRHAGHEVAWPWPAPVGERYPDEQAYEQALRAWVSRPQSDATQRLVERLEPGRSVVISFNYDVIVDFELARRFVPAIQGMPPAGITGADIWDPYPLDYGVEFTDAPQHEAPPEGRIRLYKLHGSLNWLHSRVTGSLYFRGFHKAVSTLFRLKSDPQTAVTAEELGAERPADLDPLLITPTYLKDLRNPHLAHLWRLAEDALRRAERITFIGYSLPGDDVHIKYLFKRAIETRRHPERDPEIVVVNRSESAQQHYRWFFGSGVRAEVCRFEEYARCSAPQKQQNS
jgi:hypothetical protein